LNRLRSLVVASAIALMLFQAIPASFAVSGPPGQPTNVVLTIIPPKLPADGGVYPAAVVSLQDTNGLATASLSNLTVFLSSDQTNIAAVPSSVTIPAGDSYVIANVTTTTTPGTAMITATSQGLKSQESVSVSVPITTVIPSGIPSKLLVFTSPSTFLPGLSSGHNNGTVRVEVVDQAGEPSKAITPITVSLSSSNSSIASLGGPSLVIPAGSIYADGTFTTLNPGGPAFITASSSGYSSGFASVTVLKPGACTSACVPAKIELSVVAAGSGALPTDGGSYEVIEVGLQTSSGGPITSTSATYVELTSDSPGVASVQSLVEIPAGSISTLATVTTTPLAGSATITATPASANEPLSSANVILTTQVPAPSKLQAYVAPVSVPYEANGNYPILVVQLQDSSGNPARARQDTTVLVTSSNGSLLSNFVTVGIPQGSDDVFSYLHTKGVGQSVLTAISSDLSSSQVQLISTDSPLLIRLTLVSTSLPYIYDNQTATFTFSATLDGQPVQDVNVTWGTSAGAVRPDTGNTGASGSTSMVLTPASYGAYNITALANSPQTGPVDLVYHLTVAEALPKPAPTILQQIEGFWYYIVAVVVVVVIAMVYLFRMRRKKQRAEIEAGFEVV
jgi:hypothetical protein